MSKTIEEAAKEAVRKEYLCESCAYKDDCDLCGGENTAFDCCECPADSYEDGFKAGANYVYGLPLSQRLTAEEKERVREEYWQAAKDWIDIGDARGYCRTCVALESLFPGIVKEVEE